MAASIVCDYERTEEHRVMVAKARNDYFQTLIDLRKGR